MVDKNKRPGVAQAAAVLAALLGNGHPPVAGLEDMSDPDRAFLMATCMTMLLEHLICAAASNDERRALEGLDVLVESMIVRIKAICAGENGERYAGEGTEN